MVFTGLPKDKRTDYYYTTVESITDKSKVLYHWAFDHTFNY